MVVTNLFVKVVIHGQTERVIDDHTENIIYKSKYLENKHKSKGSIQLKNLIISKDL